MRAYEQIRQTTNIKMKTKNFERILFRSKVTESHENPKIQMWRIRKDIWQAKGVERWCTDSSQTPMFVLLFYSNWSLTQTDTRVIWQSEVHLALMNGSY
jgi:hypothetical protein